MNYPEFIGFVAAIFSVSSYLPQVFQTWKTKSTKDISLKMYMILCAALLFWLLYGISIKSLPIMVTNSITLTLSSLILFLKIKYG